MQYSKQIFCSEFPCSFSKYLAHCLLLSFLFERLNETNRKLLVDTVWPYWNFLRTTFGRKSGIFVEHINLDKQPERVIHQTLRHRQRPFDY